MPARAHERRPCHRLDLCRVVGVGDGLVRGDVMRRDHLAQLVFVAGREQMLGCCEMARPPVVPRERLVRDVADEILEESVLPVLGRPRVGLNAEHLLAHER